MSVWAIIPAKPAGKAKLRLAGVLDAAARERLVAAMLDHVEDAARAARGIDHIAIIGPARARHGDIIAIADPGGGLNAALAAGVAAAAAAGATRVVIVAGDLPRLVPRDIEALAQVAGVGIAPDRHGTGTNGLSLPLPAAGGFTFAYGTGSFAAHDAEAFRLGLDIEVISTPGLARDVDVPEDLRFAAGLWRER
ncbi:MAG: 2-phospho-L-lactate guanylyltransferase [Sphingomonadales bacterium]|nr:2-phospho-L-lactate guanylyltransferase [Sphingomonadales bacterium]